MKEVIGQTQTKRKGLGSSETYWWSKAEGKEIRNKVVNEIQLNEDSRQYSNRNRENGLKGITPCRNPSHGMTSRTWRHFESAFATDQCTTSCPPTHTWYDVERMKIPLVRYEITEHVLSSR